MIPRPSLLRCSLVRGVKAHGKQRTVRRERVSPMVKGAEDERGDRGKAAEGERNVPQRLTEHR